MNRDLFDDLKVKNAVAQSARSRPSGKGRYMLPSDYLSATEKKKLNGEITVYEMKVPISWAKFKGYPKDIQKEYIQWFVDEFSLSRGFFCKMLGISVPGGYPYMKQQGFLEMFVRQMRKEDEIRFNEWLKQYRPDEETTQEEPPAEELKKEKVKVVEQPIFFNSIVGCEMNLEGKASEISQTSFSLFRDQKIAVSVVFVGGKETERAEVD